MGVSKEQQVAAEEVLNFLAENFSRQAARSDLSGKEKVEALIGNIAQASITIIKNGLPTEAAETILNTFQASVPASGQFDAVRAEIKQTGTSYGLEL
jgi:hypothetical protein